MIVPHCELNEQQTLCVPEHTPQGASRHFALVEHPLSGECKTRIDGLIGLDFFRGRIVQIDFTNNVIRLVPESPSISQSESIPVELRSWGVRVPIIVNGMPDRVRLDTGCVAGLQWVAPEIRLDACQGNKAAVGLSAISIPQMKFDVKIGKISVNGVATGVHAEPIFAGEAGLLGNGLLRCFERVTIDLKRNRATVCIWNHS